MEYLKEMKIKLYWAGSGGGTDSSDRQTHLRARKGGGGRGKRVFM